MFKTWNNQNSKNILYNIFNFCQLRKFQIIVNINDITQKLRILEKTNLNVLISIRIYKDITLKF